MFEGWEIKPTCPICGTGGADATAGGSGAPGVAVHVACWMAEKGDL